MRITYRSKNNYEYWRKRWTEIDADEPMINDDYYPLKYSNMIISDKNEKILEAGCGAGRILRHYHNKKYNIVGIDFILEAVEKLKGVDKSLNVQYGDILNLKFEDKYFDKILAFGLYHNFQTDKLKRSIDETYRVLKKGGKVCASFRADNIQEFIVDKIKGMNQSNKKEFHKLNLKKNEFMDLFEKNGFKVLKVFSVQNMPFLYMFKFFRSYKQKTFNENVGRKEGYRLSVLGETIQKLLLKYFPDSFCNIYVIIAEKNK